MVIATVFLSLFVNAIAFAATPPVAVDDSYTTTRGNALNVLPPGVLGNDTDADANPITAVKVTDPANGALTLNSNGSFTYTPNTGYTGSDTFTYKASDGLANSNIATVTISVVWFNHPPVAFNYGYTTSEDRALNVPAPGFLVIDIDTDGDPLTAIKVSNPVHGSLVLNADGAFSYTPTIDYNGTDSFTYKANDGKADSNIATVMINVIAVNDAPSFTKGSNQTVLNDGAPRKVINWATSISAGPPDESGQTLNFVIDNNSNPDLFSVAPEISPAGTLTYTPAANANGSASISISLHDNGDTADGGADTSPPQTFTITVKGGVNTPPVASNDSYTTNRNAVLNSAAPGVLANDTDADANSLTAVKVTDPAHGYLTLNADGSFTYTPVTGYSGADSFTYKANDGTADSNAATVSITVNMDSTSSETTVILSPGTTDVSNSIDENGTFTKKVEALSDDSQAVMVIEPGTSSKTAAGSPPSQFTINRTDASQNLTTGVNIVSLLYECGPSGITFNPPVTIKLSYDPAKIPAGVTETDLAVGFYDNEAKAWQKLVSIVYPATHSITARVGHLTVFAVISEPSLEPTSTTPTQATPTTLTPASLFLSELKITPNEILVGTAININLVASNTGGTAGSYLVRLSIDGVSIASKDIYLEAGQRQSLTFITSQNTVGSHSLKINDLISTIDVEPESPITNTTLAKLPLLIPGIVVLVLGLIATFLFIKTKRSHSSQVQTENRESFAALDENISSHIEKNPVSTMSLGDNNVEKAVPERNKTTFTETPLESTKSEVLREEYEKDKLVVPGRDETTCTDKQQYIKSNIVREMEHNLVIGTAPLGDKLMLFDTTCWDNNQPETNQVPLDHQEEFVRIYADISLANSVVVLANRFERRSEAVSQSYLKLRVKITEQIKMLIYSQKLG